MLRLIILSLSILSCRALTDEEIARFYNDGCANGTVSVVRLVDEIVLSSNGVPDHKWQLCNPDIVEPREMSITFPNNPIPADHPYCLSGGPIGFAINGVAIFNPFALGETNAVDGGTQETFDVCDGHPTPDFQYHYHRLPMSCIYVDGNQMEQFIGVARDGYPIYGPWQDDLGRDATNDDLDECHGRQVGDYYRYVFLGRGEENYPYVMGCYKAQPASGVGPDNTQSCEQCTNGESPCYAVGQICTCIPAGGGMATVDLLSYDDTSTDGEGDLSPCNDDPLSATCRDPHDETPSALDHEILKMLN